MPKRFEKQAQEKQTGRALAMEYTLIVNALG